MPQANSEPIYRYRIWPEHRLVVGGITGVVTMDTMRHLADLIWADPLYNTKYHGIADYRNAVFDMTPEEIDKTAAFFVGNTSAVEGRCVLLVDTPMETALSLLYSLTLRAKNDVAIFSTWTSASLFVGVSMPDPQITPPLPRRL